MRQYLLHLEHEEDAELDQFGQQLHQKLHDFQLTTGIVEIGEVISVADSIVFASGLTEIMYNELVVFENGMFGIARNLEDGQVGIIVFGQAVGIREGQIVARTYKIMSVPVGEELIGRVINALGQPIDGLGEIHATQQRAIEQPAYGVMDRQSVNEPLQTGLKAIDALVPIGKGQRELIIGDRKTGKTTIAIDAILNQKNTGVVCVYVAIGQKDTTVRSVVNTLREHGALDYTVVVNASSADAPALLYVAPYSGVTIAEYFMLQGKDVLIVYDDLTRHAMAYREISLLLGRPPGREAYPGDVFYLHSRLLERAARLSPEHGGGSITALPIVETQSSDISAYIPTNIISITDGQIFLESDLFNSGVRPAINAGLSVSRVGGNAQIKAMKKVSGTLRIDLSSYRELEAFAQFGSDLDDATIQKLERGKRVVEVLKQRAHKTLPAAKQVVILYALTHGHLDNLSLELIEKFETKLYEQLDSTSLGMKIIEIIQQTKQLPSDEELEQFITEFKELFTQQVV
ncbi:MAG: F0F1 ATP synthase subunit alpha [Culicoidibacterales bacterium]